MREAESARNRSKEEEQRKKEQLREQRSLNEQVQRTAAAAAQSLAPSAAVASAVPDTPRQSISFGIKKAPPAAAAPVRTVRGRLWVLIKAWLYRKCLRDRRSLTTTTTTHSIGTLFRFDL